MSVLSISKNICHWQPDNYIGISRISHHSWVHQKHWFDVDVISKVLNKYKNYFITIKTWVKAQVKKKK